jgi:hypothetical protein
MKHRQDSIAAAHGTLTTLKSPGLRCLAILAFGLTPLTVWGAVIDGVTITQNGSNSQYSITGTFPADFATPYGSPNEPYTLVFTVPTSPTSFSFADSSLGVFVLDAGATLNGVTYPSSQVAFFSPNLRGGLDVCLNDVCSPNPPTTGVKFEVFTDPIQIFTGPADSPTLTSGPIAVDTVQSFIESPVPEPGSIGLALLGGGVLAFGMRRRWRS